MTGQEVHCFLGKTKEVFTYFTVSSSTTQLVAVVEPYAVSNHNRIIENCRFETNSAFDGGAIYGLNEILVLMIQNCIFQQNIAAHSGGALFFYHISVTMLNCYLVENICPKSGAICFDGRANNLIVAQCKILKSSMHSKPTPYTNAVWVFAAKVVITSCTFTDNIGSGLNLKSTRGEIFDSVFYNNTGGYGGAITAPGFVWVMVITNTSFVKNRGMQASAVFTSNQRIVIQSCHFELNDIGQRRNDIVIQTRTALTLRICSCLFWKSHTQSQSVAVLVPINENAILPATLLVWDTSIRYDTNELYHVTPNTSIQQIVTGHGVHLTEFFSQFASGTFLWALSSCWRKFCCDTMFILSQGHWQKVIAKFPFQHFHCPAWMDVFVSIPLRKMPTL